MIRIPKIAVFVLSAILPAEFAADAFYVGTWKVTAAAVAPWWEDPAHPPDPAETKTLVGKTVTIGAKSIQGPRQVACSGPRYSVKEYPADMLFEGMFGEMRTRNRSADPAKIAESVGFRGSRWKTLETGCGNEVSYHFLDPDTAAFGLNNYIYTLKKTDAK